MLPPHAEVKRIELEGVAAEDLAAGALSGDQFVGVDLTEYQGGDDGSAARCVVIAKLAQAFVSLRAELSGTRLNETAPRIIVKLHTNQPLDATVAGLLVRAQDAIQRMPSRGSAQALAGLCPNDVGALTGPYSFSPERAIPRTKARWKNRKMMAVGIMAMTAMAMIS
jgi:hypothetical protein